MRTTNARTNRGWSRGKQIVVRKQSLVFMLLVACSQSSPSESTKTSQLAAPDDAATASLSDAAPIDAFGGAPPDAYGIDNGDNNMPPRREWPQQSAEARSARLLAHYRDITTSVAVVQFTFKNCHEVDDAYGIATDIDTAILHTIRGNPPTRITQHGGRIPGRGVRVSEQPNAPLGMPLLALYAGTELLYTAPLIDPTTALVEGDPMPISAVASALMVTP